jgi:putative SOS response-associated peptidase YedK
MCYSVEAATANKLKYALLRGNLELAKELQKKLEEILILKKPIYFSSGFAHPKILVFTNTKPYEPQVFEWGLIPSWAKDETSANTIRKKTLNARIESMFDLPSFKASAMNKRCLVYVDGFYEYHTAGKKKYPFIITMANAEPMIMGGLWSEWVDKNSGEIHQSFAIVTSRANALMSRIHNLPAVSEEARMPVILTKENQDAWLMDIKTEADKKLLMRLGEPLDEKLLQAHTVRQLIGKAGVGNSPEAREKYDYADLVF